MDRIYGELVDTYHKEMGLYLKELDTTPKSKRAAKHSPKPYWNESLTTMWREMHTAEKTFVKFPRNAHGYIAVKDRFNAFQKKFDKELKRVKRSTRKTQLNFGG